MGQDANSETLEITLNEQAASFAAESAAAEGFSSPAEYVIAVIAAERRSAQLKELAKAENRDPDSIPPIRVTKEFWDEERRALGL
jgi:hypothetical protein